MIPKKKVKSSHPHNRATFRPTLLWSQIQSIKHRGWEKIREWFPLFFQPSFLFVKECKFTLFVVRASSFFITKPLLPLICQCGKNMDYMEKYGASGIVCILILDLLTVLIWPEIHRLLLWIRWYKCECYTLALTHCPAWILSNHLALTWWWFIFSWVSECLCVRRWRQ